MAPDLGAAATWAREGERAYAAAGACARISLGLMALGAPPQLLDGVHRAALDDAEHARSCWARAGEHAGRPLGPAPLASPDRALPGSATALIAEIRGYEALAPAERSREFVAAALAWLGEKESTS